MSYRRKWLLSINAKFYRSDRLKGRDNEYRLKHRCSPSIRTVSLLVYAKKAYTKTPFSQKT